MQFVILCARVLPLSCISVWKTGVSFASAAARCRGPAAAICGMLLRFMVLHQRLLSCSTFSGASNCYLLASSRKPFSCAHLRTAGQCLRQHRSAAAAAHAQQDVKEPDVKPLQHSDTGAQEQPPQDQPNAKSRQEDVAIHFSADGVYTTAAPGDNLWAVSLDVCPSSVQIGTHLM